MNRRHYRTVSLLGIALLCTTVSVSANPNCSPSPEMTVGTHYIPNVAQMKSRLGEGLVIEGKILSANNCQPVPDAVIEIWQAGNDGQYRMDLRAFTLSMPDGSYRFDTEWPNFLPPHIHFIVTAENHRKLVTQWIPENETGHATFDMVLPRNMVY